MPKQIEKAVDELRRRKVSIALMRAQEAMQEYDYGSRPLSMETRQQLGYKIVETQGGLSWSVNGETIYATEADAEHALVTVILSSRDNSKFRIIPVYEPYITI